MKRLFSFCAAAIAAAALVSCNKETTTPDPEPPAPVDPHGTFTLNGQTFEYDRCVCYYDFGEDGKALCSLFFSNFEVGTEAGTAVPEGQRADQFCLYYTAPGYEAQAGEILYGMDAVGDDMAWLSIFAVGGVSTGSTQNLENGYLYSEGVDMNGDVAHPSFIVESDGVNFKFTAENVSMCDLFGTYYEGGSFFFEGQIEYKTNDEWELN